MTRDSSPTETVNDPAGDVSSSSRWREPASSLGCWPLGLWRTTGDSGGQCP